MLDLTVFPDFTLEAAASGEGFGVIVGVDEVGVGPLAGPVMAAAVWLDPEAIPEGLRDSKVLGSARRTALAEAIRRVAVVSIGQASVDEIDVLNVLAASHLAMRRALTGLEVVPDLVLVDGARLPAGLGCAARTIVRGDASCLSIAAASIVAKVARDALMVDLAQQNPGYGWERNMGYPTREHRQALAALGATAHHRRSFRPVHQTLYQEVSPSI